MILIWWGKESLFYWNKYFFQFNLQLFLFSFHLNSWTGKEKKRKKVSLGKKFWTIESLTHWKVSQFAFCSGNTFQPFKGKSKEWQKLVIDLKMQPKDEEIEDEKMARNDAKLMHQEKSEKTKVWLKLNEFEKELSFLIEMFTKEKIINILPVSLNKFVKWLTNELTKVNDNLQ